MLESVLKFDLIFWGGSGFLSEQSGLKTVAEPLKHWEICCSDLAPSSSFFFYRC